jgi:putative membrane protein
MTFRHFLTLGLVISSVAWAGKMDPTEVLSRIHKTNLQEIAAGNMAREKASSQVVKQYGDRLVRDHTDADQQVEALAKDEGFTLREPVPANDAEKAMMTKHDAMGMKLKSLQGEDFDKAFLSGMATGHEDVVKMLSSTTTSDAKVNKLIAKLLPTIREHEKMAIKDKKQEKAEAR